MGGTRRGWMVGWLLWGGACAAAGGIVVSEDTTVGDAEVAGYAAADIEIAAGATLCFSELSSAQTFSGRLTGEGAFVVESASHRDARITFAGDATAFRGGIFVTNHLVTAQGPDALGSAPFTLQARAEGSFYSYFKGPGTYACPLDVTVATRHPYGLVLEQGVTVAGAVTWRGGRLCGPGTVAGLFTLAPGATVYGQAGVHFAGGLAECTSGRLNADSGDFWIDAPVGRLANIGITSGTAHFGCVNALDATQYISIGAGYSPWGRYDLNGFDQRCGTVDTAPTKAEGLERTWFTSAAPATLTVADQAADQTFHGNLKGAFSLDYASSRARRLVLCGTENDTTGRIAVRSGAVAAETNAVFAALSGIDLSGTGRFVVRVARRADGAVARYPRFATEGLSLTVADEGVLEVPEGHVFEVNAAVVDGTPLPVGTYTGASDALAGHLAGGGTVVVLGIEKKVEGATFRWVGGADGNALRAAANWEGGAAPVFDGTERLVFGDGGTTTAVVSGVAHVFALEFVGSEPFTLAAANDAARIRVEQGGVVLTNKVDATTPCHVQACPVELAYVPQTWRIAANTQLENAAPISGPARIPGAFFTVDCSGRLLMNADNSSLYPHLVLSNHLGGACLTAQPRVYNDRALGSPTRETWLVNVWPKFMTSRRAMTNAVPLYVRSNQTRREIVDVNDGAAHPLYFDGRITFDAVQGEMFMVGNVHIRGGLAREDGLDVVLRTPGGGNWIEGTNGVSMAGTLALDYGGVFNIATSNNMWGCLTPYKCVVRLHCAGALARGRPVCLSTGNEVYRSDAGLDLNGYDQSVSRLQSGLPQANMGQYAGTVESATPATLEIAGADSFYDLGPFRFMGEAGLVFDAPNGTMALTNWTSTTRGGLAVRQGRVRICAGAGWVNVTNVVLGAAGVLEVAPHAGATAFGSEQGASAADVQLAPGGRFVIAAGETATVRTVTVADGKTTAWMRPGLYGARGTAGVAANVDWIEGEGSLFVRSTLNPGTFILMR